MLEGGNLDEEISEMKSLCQLENFQIRILHSHVEDLSILMRYFNEILA